ncbi:OSJNBa0059D20.8-like protein [Zea mays]|jgi:hypothetical protein|uniref:OSJNBa0059D20.8-like protein n=1 Tax=Zea mays TaxID=4577 RepID=A0A1D6FM79_MAIZE|nr:OSJNBa0059D20.8-like protein [Zea mays]
MSTSAPSKPPSPVQQPLLPSGQSAALPATLAATPISSGAMVLVPPGAPAAAIPPTLTLAQIVASPTDLSHAMRDVQLTLNAMLTGQLAYAAIHHSRRYHPYLRRHPLHLCHPPRNYLRRCPQYLGNQFPIRTACQSTQPHRPSHHHKPSPPSSRSDFLRHLPQSHHGRRARRQFLVMPFGLSNAPATFQALMNDVLRPCLRRFVLVFFDDILIYSTSWAEHLQHVSIVLESLRAHHLHLKRSKCSFGATSVAYLGHVILEGGVAMDADKVAAVAFWPLPQSARGLRGFLGLAGYYRKFIKDFGLIIAPLTRLLWRDAFAWDDDAQAAFNALKHALTTGPVL